jgi:hypothetical protein
VASGAADVVIVFLEPETCLRAWRGTRSRSSLDRNIHEKDEENE